PDRELVPWAQREGRMVIAYSPLGQGLLSGKYQTRPPANFRRVRGDFTAEGRARRAPLIDALGEIAGAHGATAAQVSLAWLIRKISLADVARILRPIHGHNMAKAALEMAMLDAELRADGKSFGQFFGATRTAVDCGVSVGIHSSIPELLQTVGGYLDAGYLRIKLKIKPGWDVEPVRAVRERFGDVPLQVDANTAYSLADAKHLAELDRFDLLLIEQPLPQEEVLAHAKLARNVKTPICLDESITSAQTAADAIELGACQVINIKPGRVGGYLEGG